MRVLTYSGQIITNNCNHTAIIYTLDVNYALQLVCLMSHNYVLSYCWNMLGLSITCLFHVSYVLSYCWNMPEMSITSVTNQTEYHSYDNSCVIYYTVYCKPLQENGKLLHQRYLAKGTILMGKTCLGRFFKDKIPLGGYYPYRAQDGNQLYFSSVWDIIHPHIHPSSRKAHYLSSFHL